MIKRNKLLLQLKAYRVRHESISRKDMELLKMSVTYSCVFVCV